MLSNHCKVAGGFENTLAGLDDRKFLLITGMS